MPLAGVGLALAPFLYLGAGRLSLGYGYVTLRYKNNVQKSRKDAGWGWGDWLDYTTPLM
jgi:hypothetical protein